MRIFHLHDSPHLLGGATVYLRQLVEQMAARGHENFVFSLDQAAADLPAEVGFFEYSWADSALRRRLDFHRYHPPLAEALKNAMTAFRPQLIHVQNMSVFRSTVFRALGEVGLPVLMTVHDFTLIDPNPFRLDRSGWTGKLKSHLDRSSLARAQRTVFENVDLFLCPTTALENGIPFPPGKTRLNRLPIQPAELKPAPDNFLKLFFAGTLYRSKGVDLLLQALSHVKGAAEKATLEIAGTGDQEQALRESALELGLHKRVKFLGHCDKDQMNAAYQRAHLQVLPSRVPENSPLTVLEAGARGRPSVASHAGGVPELIAPPERGWTFPSEDVEALTAVLEECAAQPQELLARGERMNSWVRREFDPVRHWDTIHTLYIEWGK